jgi:hypothetical protein
MFPASSSHIHAQSGHESGLGAHDRRDFLISFVDQEAARLDHNGLKRVQT